MYYLKQQVYLFQGIISRWSRSSMFTSRISSRWLLEGQRLGGRHFTEAETTLSYFV